ncbi:MAG: NAD+ synthase [Desulfurococcaceae archaeon]
MKITINDILNVPYEKALNEIHQFISMYLSEVGVMRVVFGLSGGLDSSVLLSVLARILPPENITALIMPDTRVTPPEDIEDAVSLAVKYGVKYHVIHIDSIVDSYSAMGFFNLHDNLPTGNLRARVRMNILYYYANKYNALVVGTSDRSEMLIGYFTKYGDGAADVFPLACLYKTQIRELGKLLGLPAKIIYKPSAPRLWRDHTAEGEIGYKYDEIDLALYALFDLNMSIEDAVEATGLPRELFEKILFMHRRSRHKRMNLVIPCLPWLKSPIREI